jgi:hypothetical protein
MRLNLGDLQTIVKQAMNEEKAATALKAEIKRVLGPVVVAEGKLENVVAEANDRLDVLFRTGRDSQLSFEPQVTTGFLTHESPEVRRFAARVVPEKYLGKVSNDKNSAVRAAVAQRVPLQAVREMMKRFRNDDQLRAIYRTRKQQSLVEAGLPKPEEQPLGHDPVDGAERMGDLARTPDFELSEAWYDEKARCLLHDYGQNMEYAWEELAVKRFCSSTRAVSGLEIDESKLLKAVKDLIKEREDLALERNSLKETLSWLEGQAELEVMAEGALPEFDETPDAVTQLVNAGLTNEQYIEQGLKLFKIQEALLPRGIRKYRLGEGNTRIVKMPAIGYLPHGGSFRSVDERALDMFCEAWTQRQQMSGEPIQLEWAPHPGDQSKISFNCILR